MARLHIRNTDQGNGSRANERGATLSGCGWSDGYPNTYNLHGNVDGPSDGLVSAWTLRLSEPDARRVIARLSYYLAKHGVMVRCQACHETPGLVPAMYGPHQSCRACWGVGHVSPQAHECEDFGCEAMTDAECSRKDAYGAEDVEG
jgi:hypothetical protein